MRFSTSITLASVASVATAFPSAQSSYSGSSSGSGSVSTTASGTCPQVWYQIAGVLQKMFTDSNGQCNSLARLAVRSAFHDCGTWTPSYGYSHGCDGSLFLSQDELSRPENNGIQPIAAALTPLASQYGVSVADMLIFASSVGTVVCPLGPTVQTMIGRTDSSTAAPDESLLPSSADLTAAEILPLMAQKGFNASDVSVMVGAHTCSVQRFADPARAGSPQDSTPGIWDVAFYGQTENGAPSSVFTFNSDKSLSQDPQAGPAFKAFVGNQGAWNHAFAEVFARLQLLGNDPSKLVDCTAALPQPITSFPGANPTTPSDSSASSYPSNYPRAKPRRVRAL